MKMKKVLSLLLVACVLFTGLTACGNKNSEEGKTSQQSTAAESTTAVVSPYDAEIAKGPAKLVYYQVGDALPESQKVWDEINKLLQKDINATVDFQCISWSDWATRYQLIFNSGENFDAAYTANWLSYTDLATKGGFYELTDELMTNYMPNTASDLQGEYAKPFKGTFVQNKAYMIPQTTKNVSLYSALVRGDLREKYGVPVLKSYADIVTYLKAIGKNESGITPLTDLGSGVGGRWFGAWAYGRNLTGVGSLSAYSLAFDQNKNDGKIFSIPESPEYLEYAKTQKELQDTGVISKSANSNKVQPIEMFKNGKSAVWICDIDSLTPTFNQVMKDHPEWKPEIVNYQGENLIATPAASGNGYVVHATSKQVERTLMMLDLFHGKKEYTDLLTLGVPGVHWEAEGDTKYKELPAAVGKFDAFGSAPWHNMNGKLERTDTLTPASILEIKQNWASRVTWLKTDGFVFDDSKVKAELAAINNICTVFGVAIDTGLGGEAEKAIASFNAKLKSAGIDKVIAEAQEQMNKYMESNK